jgi:hypothetical protein
MNAITDVMNVYITLANPLKKMIVSESVAEVVVVEDDEEKEAEVVVVEDDEEKEVEVVVVEDDEEKESEVVVVEDDDEKEAEVVVVEDDEEKESVVATESESESEESEEDDDEKEAERLALEATRNLNAIREAKRVAKEKKSMKAKITEYRADFIGNNNLAKAENNSEIARILAEIEILKREKTLMGERIVAINRGGYDEEILARKLEENAPKKIVKKAPKKIVKKAPKKEGVAGEKFGTMNWALMLGSTSRIRYGLHTDRGNCVYGLATLRADKSGLITPTDKDGNPHNWATKTTPLPNSWSTLSGFVRSVLIHNDATACKRNAFGWAGGKTTPFGEYLDRSDGLWKPLANLVLGDKIN